MKVEEYEDALFAIVNQAIEDKEMSMAQVVGLLHAAHQTILAAYHYRVFELVKTKPVPKE